MVNNASVQELSAPWGRSVRILHRLISSSAIAYLVIIIIRQELEYSSRIIIIELKDVDLEGCAKTFAYRSSSHIAKSLRRAVPGSWSLVSKGPGGASSSGSWAAVDVWALFWARGDGWLLSCRRL